MDEPTVSEALDAYIESRKNDAAESTLTSTEYRLNHFVRWCDIRDVTLNELEWRDLHKYRVWRRNDGDLAPASEKTQMDSLRVFIRWCGRMGYVPQDLSEGVISPTLTADDKRSTDTISWDRMEPILSYLDRYEFGSRDHVLLLLLWRCGFRLGGVRALDLDDIDLDDEHIHCRHRPDSDTPLKNQSGGERYVAISTETAAIIGEYIEENRVETTDEFGRQALLSTSESGRIARQTIRSACYRWTRPCETGSCPHDDVDVSECRAANRSPYACECPSSEASHAIRRGSITHAVRSDIPERVVSDRCDVTEPVLTEHYDVRDERERMESRRGYLDNI